MPPKKKNIIATKLNELESLITGTANTKLATYEQKASELCEFLDYNRGNKLFTIPLKDAFIKKLKRVLLRDETGQIINSSDFIEKTKFTRLFSSLSLLRDKFETVPNTEELQNIFEQYHQLLSNQDLIRTYFDSANSVKKERCLFEFLMTHATSVNAIEECLGSLMIFEADGELVEHESLKKMLDSLMMIEELVNCSHGQEIKKSIKESRMANLLPAVSPEFLDKYPSLSTATEAERNNNIKLTISKYFGNAKSGGSIDPVLMYSYLLRKQAYAQSSDDLGHHIALGIEKTQDSSITEYSSINATLTDFYFDYELVDIFLENDRNISSEESKEECRELFREYAAKRPIEADNAQCYIKGYSISGDLDFLQFERLSKTIAAIDDPDRKLSLYEYLFEALSKNKEYSKISQIGQSEEFKNFCYSEDNIGKNLLIHTIDADARLHNHFTTDKYLEMVELNTRSLDSLAQVIMYGCRACEEPRDSVMLVQKFTKIASSSEKNEDLICAVFDNFVAKFPCFELQSENVQYQIIDEETADLTISCCQDILQKAPRNHDIQSYCSKLLFKIYTLQNKKSEALELVPKIYDKDKADLIIENWDEGILQLDDIFNAEEISFLEKYQIQTLNDRLISEEKLLSRQKRIDQIQNSRALVSSKTAQVSGEEIDLRSCPIIKDSQDIKYFIHCPSKLLGELDSSIATKFKNAFNNKSRFSKSKGETGIKRIQSSVVELKIRGNQRILGLIHRDEIDQNGDLVNVIKLSEYCANSHNSDNSSSSEFNHLVQKLLRTKNTIAEVGEGDMKESAARCNGNVSGSTANKLMPTIKYRATATK